MIRHLRLSLSEKHGKPLPTSLLQLATWYRAQAERAGSPWIWEARLQKAEDLEGQARRRHSRSQGHRKTGT